MMLSQSVRSVFILVVATVGLAACGDDHETIVHEKPVVVQTPAPAPSAQPVIIHEHD